MDIVFDVETAPVNFGEWIVKDEETGELKDISALSPITGRITALGWIVDGNHKIFADQDESAIINNFWRSIEEESAKDGGFIRLIGFNIKKFDIHFLYVRSLHHNIKIAKFNGRQVIDLRDHLTFFQSYMKKGKLSDYAKLIGSEGKYEGIDGEKAILLWKEGKLEELKAYLLQDLNITEKLYKKCKELGILGDY